MVAIDPAQAMALADLAIAVDPSQVTALADVAVAVDPLQTTDAIAQSTSDPSSGTALASLVLGGTAFILIGTAVEGMLGALGLGGGAEAAASAAARLTVEAAAGGADVAASASAADLAAAATSAMEASAVAEVTVAGGAQMSEVVAAGAQTAEVATQMATADGGLLAAGADLVSAGVVGMASLAAVKGTVDSPAVKGLAYIGAIGLAVWAGSMLRVVVDFVRATIDSTQARREAAAKAADVVLSSVDAVRDSDGPTFVDSMSAAPFEEGLGAKSDHQNQ